MTDAVAMAADDAALAAHVAARRAALTAELDRIRAQKALLEAKLAELRPAGPPPKKGGGAGAPVGSAGKKRPGGAGAGRAGEPPYDPTIPLTGPAKRARVEADRERRVNLLWQQCATIAKTLMRHRDSAPFHKPVDPVALKCPDYLTIIKSPMDLGTALGRLGGTPGGPARVYSAPAEFRDDVRQMFANCRTYNKVGTPVRRMGDALSDLWEKKWAQQGIEAKWALEMERQKDEQLELDGAPEHVIKMRQMDRELRALQEVAAAAGGPAPPRPTHPGERDMGFEEKRRLSTALGSLPCDKLGKALDIVAAAHPLPEGADEVELDIDALGRETLWKLDAYCLSVMPQIHVAKDKPSAAATAAANAAGAWAASGRAGLGGEAAAAAAAPGGPPAKPAPPPLPAGTAGTTKAGSDSGSQGEVGSKQGSGASGELKKPSAGGPGGAAAPDMSALVSATRPGGPGGAPGPAIIKHMAHKKEVTLQNAGAWAGLASDAGGAAGGAGGADGAGPATGAGSAEAVAAAPGAAGPGPGGAPTTGGGPPAGPGGGGGGGDNLWAEFQSREEAQQVREAAKAAEDARLKADQATKEAAAAAELEAKRRAAEEEAAAAAAAKAAEEEAARAAAEEARRAELDAMRNVARPDEEAGGDAGAAALLQAAGGAAAGFGLVHADEDEDDDDEDEEMEDGEA